MAATSNATSGPKSVRCAIYTRKSTDDGLNREFNSLDAQREAAEVYISANDIRVGPWCRAITAMVDTLVQTSSGPECGNYSPTSRPARSTCLPAVGLAVGDRTGASGQETLSAMVAGYEVAGRMTDAIIASSASRGRGSGAISRSVGSGFHASSIVAFGGAVTAAKLLGLSDEQMAHAIGITATSVGGLSIGTNSWAREYHAGNAALTSVNAALAASRGYRVNPDMLEARGGFLAVFGGGVPDAGGLLAELKYGSDDGYQISRYLAVKLVPGAHALHPAVEAAVNAARQSNAKPEDVKQILVAGPQSGLVADVPPADVIQAIHSLSYYIASAVADKDFSWVHAEPAMIERPVIRRLIGLVA